MLSTWITHLLSLFAIMVLVPSLSRGQEDSARVENGSFIMVGDTVIITYQLIAAPEGLFNVSVTLRRESDPEFLITVHSAVGAIGRVRGGGQKAIFWDYRREVPGPFEYAQDYWFEITATSVVDTTGPPIWAYVAAGVGIVAAVIVFSDQSSPGEAPIENLLPDPPGIRPDR
jgi:hypothetical protein